MLIVILASSLLLVKAASTEEEKGFNQEKHNEKGNRKGNEFVHKKIYIQKEIKTNFKSGGAENIGETHVQDSVVSNEKNLKFRTLPEDKETLIVLNENNNSTEKEFNETSNIDESGNKSEETNINVESDDKEKTITPDNVPAEPLSVSYRVDPERKDETSKESVCEKQELTEVKNEDIEKIGETKPRLLKKNDESQALKDMINSTLFMMDKEESGREGVTEEMQGTSEAPSDTQQEPHNLADNSYFDKNPGAVALIDFMRETLVRMEKLEIKNTSDAPRISIETERIQNIPVGNRVETEKDDNVTGLLGKGLLEKINDIEVLADVIREALFMLDRLEMDNT